MGVRRFKAVLDRLNERNDDLTYEMLSLRSTGESCRDRWIHAKSQTPPTSLGISSRTLLISSSTQCGLLGEELACRPWKAQ